MKSDPEKIKKKILLKITGEIFSNSFQDDATKTIDHLVEQISTLIPNYKFSFVIGGGNIFRGTQQSKLLKISSNTSHYAGILATMINGLILQDILNNKNIKTKLFSALHCPEIGSSISPQNLKRCQKSYDCLIFSGGTGNPYFTTDSNAVLRAIQTNSDEVWKGTKVPGVFDQDPNLTTDATLLKKISYDFAINQKLKIMDSTAFALAKEHKLKIRIFNIFEKNSLIKASESIDFGSTIQSNN